MVDGRKMQKIKNYLRHYHVTEEGSVLLVALGVIVLLFVIIAGIFFYALDTQKNILLADRYTTLKDAKSYALEESKTRLSKFLDQEIPQIINEVTNPSIDGDLVSKLKEKLDTVSTMESDGQIKKPFFSSTSFGADKQYQFKVAASSATRVEAGSVYGHEVTGGWSDTSSGGSQVAKRITIPITVEVVETKDGTPITHSASSHLVYEVQWSEKSTTPSANNAPDPSNLDAWRNIFYTHYTNGENGLISADTWTRLLYRGYKYPGKTPQSANQIEYDGVAQHGLVLFGGVNKHSLANIKLTDTSNFLPELTPKDLPNKSLVKNLESRASFIIEDIGLDADLNELQIKAGNILAFTSSNLEKNARFNKIVAYANTGIFIARPKQVTTFDTCKVQTQSLFITQTRKDRKEGLTFKGTEVSIGGLKDRFDYSDYLKPVSLDNPQKHPRWSDMMKGGMVVAGSTVELNRSKIKLGENSNFMLTNATIKEDAKGEESFSYQTSRSNSSSSNAVFPNPPSVLKISNVSTVNQDANGLSFIDAPKKNRRQSSTENSSQVQDDWLDVEVGRNTIEIGEKSELNLGITGIEPFKLKLDKGGIFSFYAPSDPSLLDTTFLKNGLKSGAIKGKVIIYERSGGFDVATYLKDNGITSVSTKPIIDDAVNGEVTIIKASSSKAKSRNIIRTFSYMVDVDFKKTK